MARPKVQGAAMGGSYGWAEPPSARALPVGERDECAAGRGLDLTQRLVVVRDRREVVRAALEDHPGAHRLGEEVCLACGIVPPQQEHRVDSVRRDALDAARRDRAVENGAELASGLG